jgi:hypothetical protein
VEDKREIYRLLLATLQATYSASDLVDLEYDGEAEIVTATFASGGFRRINVAMDSGTAMIRDIVNHIGC